ncbi:MAG: hypothetical protein DRR42_11375 [Gammaproteobacteria bacterium]|nr:MAG: hypothetical protein DRR42_11375 [Gammaproteobacteria bacterium]
MSPNDETDLNVTVSYDKDVDLITITFEQDKRRITIGFNIPEAQMFNTKITHAITEAILGKLNINLPPPLPETRH